MDDNNQGFTKQQKTELVQLVGEVVEDKLKPLKTKLRKIQKDLDVTINTFDRYHLDHEKRLKHLESTLAR